MQQNEKNYLKYIKDIQENEENKKALASDYSEALTAEYLSAYLKGLKAKASVSVNQKFFETTQKN